MKVRSDIVSDNSGSDNVALTSVPQTCSQTIPAVIDIAVTCSLPHDLTNPAAIHVTVKSATEMGSGSDKVRKRALPSAGFGYQPFLLRSTCYVGSNTS
jgi:hypothetical protein